ncbi:MAG: DUF4230 domain-containing protein [Cytophagales bacterium]|nr:DUF4230 domain-containing protein [Cytophagales bacterium]
MTKIINRVLAITVLAFLIFFGWNVLSGNFKNPFGIKTIESTHSLILEKTKALGNLELVTFQFKDIIDQKLSRDYLPDPRALLIVHGEAVGCINLSKIQKEDIRSEGDTITIMLPQPELCQYKIDHAKSSIYDAQYAFMNEALLFEEAYKSAEKKLKQSALESGILETTKENAQTMLKPLLESISQKPVLLKFTDN